MKINLTFLIFILFIVFSCAQNSRRDVAKEIRIISSNYKSISVSGPFNVYINEGENSGKIELEADTDMLQNIVVEVKKQNLKIRIKTGKWTKRYSTLNVYITAKDLDGLILSGSGSIVQEGINNVNSFRLVLSGSGDIKANINAKKVSAVLSGSGDINIDGATNDLEVSVSGSGDIMAKNLKAKDANVIVSGSAGVEVYASNHLSAKISGSGKVMVHGSPNRVKSNVVGSGDVIEL